MRTERQIQASRANGTRSRGPVTAQGKRNSSRNAVKHGLLAETIVLKSELTDRFLEIVADWKTNSIPRPPSNTRSSRKWPWHAGASSVSGAWRGRLWNSRSAEKSTTARMPKTSQPEHRWPFAPSAKPAPSDMIIRYDSLCDRQYLRAHRRFLEMRPSRSETVEPSKPRTRQAEVVPIRDVPCPEPDQTEQSDKKNQTNPRTC